MRYPATANDATMNRQPQKPRTLIFSQRNIFRNDLFRCPLHEFEDIVTQIDHAEIVAPQADPSTRRNHLANLLAFHAPITLTASLEKLQIDQHYDLFLAVCGHPRDLLMVHAASQWRDACKTSVCLLDELWVKQMDDHRFFLRVLEGFDLVVLYYSQSVEALQKRIGRRCVFLPPGVDSIRFCPYPTPPKRVVDVYSVGRRSQITHQSLLRMAEEYGLFYLHDSIAGLEAINPKEHRDLFANVAKRSRYFIVNPGLIDLPERRGDQIEIGNRYFEGASAGAILVGEIPSNGEFERLFDWPDALIHVPYNSDKIDAVINELDAQPERQQRLRRTNIVQALTRHDWVYRWEAILRHVGLEPLPELAERKERLKGLADSVSRDDSTDWQEAGRRQSATQEPVGL
jgi:hypothetical protein